MNQWEYYVLNPKDQYGNLGAELGRACATGKTLTELGNEGWEIACTYEEQIIFKRRKI